MPGTEKPIPTIFKPLQIRGVTMRNRITVSPMCQYSSANFGPTVGALTDWHVATLGHYAIKGAGLVFIEATGVQANGRISVNCPGLWSDAQIPAVRRVADFVKSQGALCGIQLGHAGLKASSTAIWLALRNSAGRRFNQRAGPEVGGWPEDVVGPMGGEEWTWDGLKSTDPEAGYWAPRALSEADIKQFTEDFGKAAFRAVQAGVDLIEIHGAHGYLIGQFLSPVSNQRTDKYGGSFENRTRLLVEVIHAIRSNIPETMPLFLRISGSEWLEDTEVGRKYGSWTIDDSIALAKLLPGLGVDLIDVSSGGGHPSQKIDPFGAGGYQNAMSAKIRAAVKKDNVKLLVGAVGLITEAEQARDIIDGKHVKQANSGTDGGEIVKEAQAIVKMTEQDKDADPMADVVFIARQFLREPEWVLKVAQELGVPVAYPTQFSFVQPRP